MSQRLVLTLFVRSLRLKSGTTRYLHPMFWLCAGISPPQRGLYCRTLPGVPLAAATQTRRMLSNRISRSRFTARTTPAWRASRLFTTRTTCSLFQLGSAVNTGMQMGCAQYDENWCVICSMIFPFLLVDGGSSKLSSPTSSSLRHSPHH
jgi:hypothetical protein